MKKLLIHVGLVFLALLLLLGLVHIILNTYTHKGEKLSLPNYVGLNVADATSRANDKSFEIVVQDSIFMVGKPGGEILRQNPDGGAEVKENRKVYVTITKYEADEIKVEQLPKLYGRNFERKAKELKIAFALESKVVGYRADKGAPDHILEVRQNGKTIIDRNRRRNDVKIKKGTTLEYILSKTDGAEIQMPDLVCKSYNSAVFQLEVLRLKVKHNGGNMDLNNAYVIGQIPAAFDQVLSGDEVQLMLSPTKPASCN